MFLLKGVKKMYIGEIIKNYREINQLSQRAFASRTSLSPSYINTLEKIYNPKTGKPYSVTTDAAVEIAKAMNLSIEDLLSKLDKKQEFKINDYTVEDTPAHILSLAEKSEEYSYNQSFPILGLVKAGYDYLASENIIGYVYTDKKVSDPKNYFALKITGNSMEPILYEDDIIIVHSQNDVENGQIGIVLIDNEETTVKKIIKHNDFIELIAFNSYYPPRKLTKQDKFKIIGRVTEARISKIFE